MSIKKAYIIAGPTASGKSDFAHLLAKKINGTIINCDSVQIYQGIENLSASPFAGRPISEEIDGIPYKLFSILPLSQQITVTDFMAMARREYNAAISAGRVPIFVGGTGYYINGLISGMVDIPDIEPEIRNRARMLVSRSIPEARKMLPNCTTLDPQRLARALEVFLQTGKTIQEWWAMQRNGAITPTPYKIFINPPIEVLRARIVARIPKMISGGAVDEVRNIIKNRLNPRRAIGATQLFALLHGDVTRKDAIDNWIIKTNQYAKRQRTWFNNQYNADLIINHIPTLEDLQKILGE